MLVESVGPEGDVVRTVYVVTHPEATHHVDGVVGGWFDSQLTERGVRDADAIAGRLRELIPAEAPTALYSSDLTRAAQTAEVVARRLGVSPDLMTALRERSFGEAEGRPQTWFDDRYAPPPPTGDRLNHHEGIPGAETKHDFGTRIYQAVDRILEGAGEHQVVVTHGSAVTFFVTAFTRIPLAATGYLFLRTTGGGISTLREDSLRRSRVVEMLNSTDHLAAR